MKNIKLNDFAVALLVIIVLAGLCGAMDGYDDAQMDAQYKRESIQAARIAAAERGHELRAQVAWDSAEN